METITLNCPTFCELLLCSAGLVRGLDSAFARRGHVSRGGKNLRGPAPSRGPQEGPRFHSGSFSPSRYRGPWCPTGQLGSQEKTHYFSEQGSPASGWSGGRFSNSNQPCPTPSLASKDGVLTGQWCEEAEQMTLFFFLYQ